MNSLKLEMVVKNIFNKWYPILTTLIVVTFCLISCSEDDASPLITADFNMDFIDANNVRFTNQSEGEYNSLTWEFGNGESESNSFKTRTYEVYYPESGTYNVSLRIGDFDGNVDKVTKELVITKNDLLVAFTAAPDALNPNKINLVNTSEGNYDSFKWIFKDTEVENENTTIAYFPYKGDYEIELQVVKDEVTYSKKLEVTLADDDPNYISSFVLTWADEFDGNEVNTYDWTFETGSNGWGNNELQNYTNGDNAEVKEGKLILTAKKVNDNLQPGSYTSTRMITKGKKEFLYGRMEISAKLPSGRGIWPAIWMLGANIDDVSWPACGEIDVMEYVGYQPNTIHATVHTPSGYGANGNGSSKMLNTAEEEFHVYGVIWTEKEMVFYTDSPENVTHTYAPINKTSDNWPFNKPHFFILNIAVGGNWGGAQGIDNSIFPQTMEIDYVRVYQPEL